MKLPILVLTINEKINYYMWQKHTQVKLSTKDYNCSIRGVYQTGPYFYKIGWRKKNKTKEKTRLCLLKLTATTPAIQWITWFSKHTRTKLPTNFNIKYTTSSKKNTTTNHGLLEVNTITNQGISINKEKENETNASPAYKSLPLPQS